MKIQKILPLALLFILPMHSSANSEDGNYLGFHYALGSYSETGFPDYSPNMLVGRFGSYVQDDFAIEGRIGIGAGSDSNQFLGVDVTLEVDTLFGAYALKQINLENGGSIYGVVGISKIEATGAVPVVNFSRSDDETGASFGVGMNAGNFNIEFMQYLNKSTFDYSAISFGVIF